MEYEVVFPNAAVIAVISAARQTEPQTAEAESCVICGGEIKTMVFKGTGVCGERDRKKRDHIEVEERAVSP